MDSMQSVSVPTLAELAALTACPSCGSTDLMRVEPSLLQRALMWGTAPRSAFQRSRQCRSCGCTTGVEA